METFIKTAPNNEYLMEKVALVLGIAGVCRREEIADITVYNIQDVQSVLTIKIQKSKIKIQRVFTVVNYPEKPSYLAL